MPSIVSQGEASQEVQPEALLLEFQEFVAKVNDRSIPNDTFGQSASQYKLRIDSYEENSDPVGDSTWPSNLEPRSYDDQAIFAASYREQQGPTLPQEITTSLPFDVAASPNTTTTQFSQTTTDDALNGKTGHCISTEYHMQAYSSDFEGIDSDDEQEQSPVEVMTARTITLQRLPVTKAGPYYVNGAQSKTQSGYHHSGDTEPRHQSGKRSRSEYLPFRTDIDGEVLQECESYPCEPRNGRTSSPLVHHQVIRRRYTGDISEADAPGNTTSMPRFSWILPRKTDSTFISDAHILRLTLLPRECTSHKEHTYHPAIMLPGPRDSTFLYDFDVLHISLWGETTSGGHGTGEFSSCNTNTTGFDKRNSLFLWKNNGTPVEIPVSESCWDAASRLCRVQTEIATSGEHDYVYADLHQLGVMVEMELANWL